MMPDAADGRYLSTGYLVFLRQGTLMAVPFALGRLEAKGQPVPVAAQIMQALNVSHYNTAAGQYCVSKTDILAYVSVGILPDEEDSLVRVDQKGNSLQVADSKAPCRGPRFSADGNRIAYHDLGTEWRLMDYDVNRGIRSPPN